MTKLRFYSLFTRQGLPSLAILLISLVFLATNFSHHKWTITKPERRGVISGDVTMYYAYLSAGIIEGDLRLDFMSEPGFKNEFRYWNTRAENGNRLIITSMGLSFMYVPFFLTAHLLANIFGLPTDGYGSIYQFFLVFAGFFYAVWGLFLLKKILLRYFSPVITAVTLILVTLGTNLYYYSTYEAAMSHVFNFFLITAFLLQVIRWYEAPGWRRAIYVGGLLGLISLVRPTNILIFFVLFLWDVKSFRELWERIIFYLQKYYLVMLMLMAFMAVWTPQMLYWKMITGKFLYFSYGAAGASFYFLHPQIPGSLFSFLKGWYVYTPVMLFASLGVILLWRRIKTAFWPVLLLLLGMIYVQSSWWSWYFGGGFGLRAYIDIYAVMAIPLAALIEFLVERKNRWLRFGSYAVGLFLLYMSVFQTYQYSKNMIHYCGMTKEAYFKHFLRLKPAPDYWQSLNLPDHRLARKGIYYYYHTGADNSQLAAMEKETALDTIIEEIKADSKLERQVRRYAESSEITYEEGLNEVAERIYYRKTDK
jgi:hypothetical protein